MKLNKEKLEAMREILEIQGSDGNWDYDEYMLGMFNGMELLMAMVDDRTPIFRKAPAVWRCDEELEKLIGEPVRDTTIKFEVIKGGKE